MIYLCSVYSTGADSDLMQKRYEYVSKRTAEFLKQGFTVFSPIVHCHLIANKYDIQKDWSFWRVHDLKYIDASNEVWVLMMPNYEQSKGMNAEIYYAKSIGMQVKFIECPDYKE